MDIKQFIDSGILEQFCLGLANEAERAEVMKLTAEYPEIGAELEAIERSMINFAESENPVPQLKNKILARLGFAADVALDINNLPPADKYANYINWLQAVEHLISAEPFEDLSIQVLQQNNAIAQMLVVAKVDVPEESHDSYAESFFILKGKCRCTIDNVEIELGPGDFLEIPLYAQHDVKMLTPYVVAILQYRFVG